MVARSLLMILGPADEDFIPPSVGGMIFSFMHVCSLLSSDLGTSESWCLLVPWNIPLVPSKLQGEKDIGLLYIGPWIFVILLCLMM